MSSVAQAFSCFLWWQQEGGKAAGLNSRIMMYDGKLALQQQVEEF